jgi:hypothetical protein
MKMDEDTVDGIKTLIEVFVFQLNFFYSLMLAIITGVGQ